MVSASVAEKILDGVILSIDRERVENLAWIRWLQNFFTLLARYPFISIIGSRFCILVDLWCS